MESCDAPAECAYKVAECAAGVGVQEFRNRIGSGKIEYNREV